MTHHGALGRRPHHSSHWKRRRVFFLLVRRMSLVVIQFSANRLFFSLLLLSLLPKKLPSTWVVSMPFSVLFHLERHVIAYSGRIVVDGCLISPPRFSLRTGNVHHCPLCFLLFNFNPHFINFLFRFFSIYTSFILFNLVLQL